MAVSSITSNSETKQMFVEPTHRNEKQESNVKNEVDGGDEMKCLICLSNDAEHDIYCTSTNLSHITLYKFICKFTQVNFEIRKGFTKYMCTFCLGLVNILEQAEEEYNKLKNNFECIIRKNPLFEGSLDIVNVKRENIDVELSTIKSDSDDEPLSLTKTKRSKEKKTKTRAKKKVKKNEKCNEAMKNDREPLWLGLDETEVQPKVEHENYRTETELENGFDYKMKEEKYDSFHNDDDTQDYGPDCDYEDDELNGDDIDDFIDKAKKTTKKKKNEKIKKKVYLKCDQCDAKYSSPVRLACHKLKHDNSKPPYICEICGAHYKHRRACDIHIALHKGISDWKCEECNKLFPSKGALQRHNNIHTGKPIYQCDLCGKSFIHTSSFKMHKLAHSGIKAHTCATCGLSLMTRSHLQRHQRVHSGEKKHQCPLCGKRFSERYNLLAHSKSHSVNNDQGPNNDALAAVIAAAPRRRLFRCPFCEQRFERRYMLERHMERDHQRPLERVPPRPRNTMSKLLKAQAAASTTTSTESNNIKNEPGRESNDRPQALTNTETEKTQVSSESPELPAGTRNWHAAYAVYTHYASNT